LGEYFEAGLFGFGRAWLSPGFRRRVEAVLVKHPHILEVGLTDRNDSDACGLGAEFGLEAETEFLTDIAIEFAEEGAELYADKAVVEADVGGAVAEFVVFDVVDEEARHFGSAAAKGLLFEDAGVTVFAGHKNELATDLHR
jgi:hypothetical protein